MLKKFFTKKDNPKRKNSNSQKDETPIICAVNEQENIEWDRLKSDLISSLKQHAQNSSNDKLYECMQRQKPVVDTMDSSCRNLVRNSTFACLSPGPSKFQTALFRQLAHYPRTESGSFHERPRVANYCNMEHSGGKNMAVESRRLETFHNWPSNRFYIPSKNLAKAGFYHESNYRDQPDRVKCAFCRGVLHSWEKGDEAIKEHRRSFSTCPFVLSMNVGNIPTPGRGNVPEFYVFTTEGAPRSRKEIQFQFSSVIYGGPISQRCDAKYMFSKARVKSFSNLSYLPRDTARELSRMGFYFTGRDRIIKCYKCHFQTSISDDAIEHHSANKPPCPYLTARMKETSPTLLSQSTSDNPSLSLLTPKLSDSEVSTRNDCWAVRQARMLGFDVDIVCYAVMQYQYFSGEHATSLKSLIDNLKELEDEMGKHSIDLSNPPLALMAWKSVLEQKEQEHKKTIEMKYQSLLERIRKNPQSLRGFSDDPEINDYLMELNKNDRIYQEKINEKLRNSQLCKVCLDSRVDMIFIPCHHIVACTRCSDSLTACPMCRCPIESLLQANLEL